MHLFLSLFAMPQMSIVSKSYIESGADLGESTMGTVLLPENLET